MYFLSLVTIRLCFIFKLNSSERLFTGNDKPAVQRRSALVHALTLVSPPLQSKSNVGKRSGITAVCRSVLYALAPAGLWQYFCLSGSKKASILDCMPNIYRAVMTAVTEEEVVMGGIAEAVRTAAHRASSKKYKRSHPEYDCESFNEAGRTRPSTSDAQPNSPISAISPVPSIDGARELPFRKARPSNLFQSSDELDDSDRDADFEPLPHTPSPQSETY